MHSAMEQRRNWMSTRRKSVERPLFGSSIYKISTGSFYNESWEEQAFAEDFAGHLGGCVWPPRSYSCTFCRREFRSAQALGGHMNVHRRDRARLKQSSSPTSESHGNHDQHHHRSLCTPLGPWYLDQVGSPVCNSNPNPNCDVIASVVSPRASAASTRENSQNSLVISPPYSSTIVQGNPMKSLFTATRSLMDPTAARQLTLPELKLGRENPRLREVGFRFSRNPGHDEEETISSKRQRTDPFSFLKGVAPVGPQKLHSELLKLCPCPDEEFDLELRLGHLPKDK